MKTIVLFFSLCCSVFPVIENNADLQKLDKALIDVPSIASLNDGCSNPFFEFTEEGPVIFQPCSYIEGDRKVWDFGYQRPEEPNSNEAVEVFLLDGNHPDRLTKVPFKNKKPSRTPYRENVPLRNLMAPVDLERTEEKPIFNFSVSFMR